MAVQLYEEKWGNGNIIIHENHMVLKAAVWVKCNISCAVPPVHKVRVHAGQQLCRDEFLVGGDASKYTKVCTIAAPGKRILVSAISNVAIVSIYIMSITTQQSTSRRRLSRFVFCCLKTKIGSRTYSHKNH
jgi:hypothetical protein